MMNKKAGRQGRVWRTWELCYWLIPCIVFVWLTGLAPRSRGLDLIPTPDAEEYALLANRLAQFQAPLIAVGLHEYPSRYSPAYPMLLAPLGWVFQFDVSRYHWGAWLFGLLAAGLLARVGSWLLCSRLAGVLAALLWVCHPRTTCLAVVNMSETALTMMFCVMLELARPWLKPDDKNKPGLARGVAVGLALGWLTLAKAPFAWWAVGMGALALWEGRRRGDFRSALALIIAGLGCALADLIYRRWAFGSWDQNGYAYWVPEIYGSFGKTFNWNYLMEPWSPYYPSGNLKFYGAMVLGRADDFYGRYMPLVLAGSTMLMIWPRRLGGMCGCERPTRQTMMLMAGWTLVVFIFCGCYFYQDARFAFLWMPVPDLLAAWGLTRPGLWHWANRGRAGKLKAWGWLQVAGLAVALLIMRGEYRRIGVVLEREPRTLTGSRTQVGRALLKKVPQGAWLLSNYELAMMPQWRKTQGPVGSIYTWGTDSWMNGHVFRLESEDLTPRRAMRMSGAKPPIGIRRMGGRGNRFN